MYSNPLVTNKGKFTFTLVSDGVYIEHKWGQNSGHIGIPKESIADFARYLAAAGSDLGVSVRAAVPTPKKTLSVSDKGKAITKAKGKEAGVSADKKKEKPKKEKEAKPTLEDLDADLMNYQSARGSLDGKDVVAAPAGA